MKRTYIQPAIELTALASEGVMTASVGLNDGNIVGNQKPTDDTDDNFFSQRQGFWDWNE